MVLYRINYINPDVCLNFLIDYHGVFPSIHITISYPWTMSTYGVLLSISSPSIYTMDSIPFCLIRSRSHYQQHWHGQTYQYQYRGQIINHTCYKVIEGRKIQREEGINPKKQCAKTLWSFMEPMYSWFEEWSLRGPVLWYKFRLLWFPLVNVETMVEFIMNFTYLKPISYEFTHYKGCVYLHQCQTDSMDYFYRRFDYFVATCKLTGYNANSFTGWYKHTDDIKYDGQHMSVICLIKTSDQKQFYHIYNEL